MSELFSQSLIEQITNSYESNMKYYQEEKAKIDAFINGLQDEDERVGMLYSYAFMPAGDIVTYEIEDIYPFVKTALITRTALPYAQQVPADIFLAYVLFYRINNENLDEHRTVFYQELLKRVLNLDMKQAVLEVNYWCYEKATYISTDIRTVAPLTMIKRAEGRCGEESVIAVAALRSVGIPARQCYVPRWAHCDDNHAWVEVWADGEWYYIGACEPEPILNKGWFTAAASKSMLTQAKTFSNLIRIPGSDQTSPIVEMVNSTQVYGDCKMIEITVMEENRPKKGITVLFELINMGEFYPIRAAVTDEEGKAALLTGLGDLCIHIHDGKRFLLQKIDIRKETKITLYMEQAITAEEFTDVHIEQMELVPPVERVAASVFQSDIMIETHKNRLTVCEQIRADYKAKFLYSEEAKAGSVEWYLNRARGNHSEISRFLELQTYTMEEKKQLLSTLKEKDFADITFDLLCEYMEASKPFQMFYSESDYVNYVLAPRVANEMIRSGRFAIQAFYKDKEIQNPAHLWEVLTKEIRIVDEFGCETILCSAYGSVKHGKCGIHSFSILYVLVCRALGMAARINPVNHEPEYLRKDADGAYTFIPAKTKLNDGMLHADRNNTFNEEAGSKCTDMKEEATSQMFHSLVIKNQSGRNLAYDTHITIGRLKEGCYETLSYPDTFIEDTWTIQVEPGSYRIVTCNRQIDGAVSAKLYYLSVPAIREVSVELCEDETAKKLKDVVLPNCSMITLQGEKVTLDELCKDKDSIVVYAEPGKEPTEHLLQELLGCKEELIKTGFGVCVILSLMEESNNLTLKKVCKEIPNVNVCLCQDSEYKTKLRKAMTVGDERLPLAIAVTNELKGLYAFSNYNIGTAQTLVSILKHSANQSHI